MPLAACLLDPILESMMARQKRPRGSLTTWVCVTCGNEIFGRAANVRAAAAKSPKKAKAPAGAKAPARAKNSGLVCPRCGGRVFREFDTPAPRDQVARDYLETTARHLDLGDPTPDTRLPDVRDLENL
jgi:predicted RNA-binding Zn-ribbon protein involved in translation (DUF1610 family)